MLLKNSILLNYLFTLMIRKMVISYIYQFYQLSWAKVKENLKKHLYCDKSNKTKFHLLHFLKQSCNLPLITSKLLIKTYKR